MDTEKDRFTTGEEPREKLVRLGARALTDRELIMLLIAQGNGARSVEEISSDVLNLIDRGVSFPLTTLMNIPGVGRAKGAQVLAALELGRRKNTRKPRHINSSVDIYQEVRHFASRDQESLIVVSINGAMEILDTTVATIGFVDRVFSHPREIFAEALKKRSTAIAIAHNHPSGHIFPSKDDVEVTKRIIRAGDILGVTLVDHIIFSEDGYYSFLEQNILEKIRKIIREEDGRIDKRKEGLQVLEEIRKTARA